MVSALLRSPSTSKRKLPISFRALLSHGFLALVCLYAGMLMGMAVNTKNVSENTECKQPFCPPCPACPEQEIAGIEAIERQADEADEDGEDGGYDEDEKDASLILHQDHKTNDKNHEGRPFPATMANIFVDYATVHRDDFNRHLELGVPFDDTAKGAEEVLVLYTSESSKPKTKDGRMHGIRSRKAFESCGVVKVVLTEPHNKKKAPQCIALVPQWESYHIHKYMRVPEGRGEWNIKYPLRYVGRTHSEKRPASGVPELRRHTLPAYKALVEYLTNLDPLLRELDGPLKELLRKSSNPESKTIIVQVCNYGQVELFHNFLCSAKARGLDYSHVFMFATDEKTYALCQKLGITAYYNEAIFGDMPEAAARGYGDRIFVKMMMAKVYCVHLVLSLGYNVLFQDVDLIWYKNPLPYFESPELEKWDMMFQDDGNRQPRYAPFSPNTGFYFVRHSEKTLYLFGVLLRSGDYIHRVSSHQAALTALVNENVSAKGLRVKVWKKGETTPFPGGFEYHRKKELMRKMVKGKADVEPYIFHMSWTKNKDNKKLYFEQLGEWFMKDKCLSGWDCCLPEANVTCHYRDKASKIPCKKSPNIDKGRPSFW